MPERTSVSVEAHFALDGTITPLAVVKGGERRAVAAVGRRWDEVHPDEGRRTYFDVQMASGRTMILYLERPSLRWYVVGTWGRWQMA